MPDPSDALRAQITAELDEIKDPCSIASGTPMGLAEMGLVDAIECDEEGAVLVKLRLTSPFCHMIGYFKKEAIRRIEGLPGVAAVDLQADNGLAWSPSRISPAAAARRNIYLDRMANAAT